MAPKKEPKLIYGVAVVLLIIGVLGYAVAPAQQPEEPVRMVFTVVAGKVLFDHKTHVSDTGYALSCMDCHHHPPDDDTAEYSCGDCHNTAADGSFPESCADCHDPESEPEFYEEPVMKRGDAFHMQCIDCHQNYGAGPVECSECHYL